RRPLPRNDPRAMAQIIRHCTPKVVDTAHLHGALGGFKRLGLTKFAEDAKVKHQELAGHGNVPHLKFRLVGETASRYGSQADRNELAHEAGFDSLVTAQLFAYLRAISPTQVREGANRLFLYKSIEYLDLDRAALEGEVGVCMFDLSRGAGLGDQVTLLVAALDTVDGNDAPRLITNAGYLCKWIDTQHILVVMRASGGAAVRKAAELAGKVHGVVSWMGFDEWREGEKAKVALKGQDDADTAASTVETATAVPEALAPSEVLLAPGEVLEAPLPKEEMPSESARRGEEWWQQLSASLSRLLRQQPKPLAAAGFMLALWLVFSRADVDSALS
ncbi:PARN, partial [Symbiodinium pilosum]